MNFKIQLALMMVLFSAADVAVGKQDFYLSKDQFRDLLSLKREQSLRLELDSKSNSKSLFSQVEPFEPRGEQAITRVIDAKGERRIDPKPWKYFLSSNGTGSRLSFGISPDGKTLHGSWVDANGVLHDLKGRSVKIGFTIEATEAGKYAQDGEPLDFHCAGGPSADLSSVDELPSLSQLVKRLELAGENIETTSKLQSGALLGQFTLAFDTDNEFMSQKFSDNTTNATTYIDAVVVGMNTIYERDLNVRFVRGDTTLRLSSAADPYAVTGSPAGSSHLNEYSEWWRVNKVGTPRAFSMMLSGKSTNNNSSSGIAWLLSSGSYCAATGTQFGNPVQTFGHYSVTQVFKFAQQTATSDMLVLAHELGHNFGAYHTHCTSNSTGTGPVATNTVDQCFSGESFGAGQACYSGPVSCPEASGLPDGSLMSYCHLGGANCGGNPALQFAPAHISFLNTRVAAQPGTCLAPVSGADNIFANGFE